LAARVSVRGRETFIFFAHVALFLLRTPMIALLPPASVGSGGVHGSVWMTVARCAVLLLTTFSAFLHLAIAKEPPELRHRKGGMVDPLTGIPNRRSFLHDASMLAKLHI